MFHRFVKGIEIFANIAILVVATLLAVTLIKVYWFNHPVTSSASSGESVNKANVSALDIDWTLGQQTLVLAVSTTCHFCSASGPFYKTLVSNKGNTRIVAVLPQSVEEGREYLKKLGVAVDDIKQVDLTEIGVSGTPSLVLVDKSGVVRNLWIGKLAVDKERAVLDALQNQKG